MSNGIQFASEVGRGVTTFQAYPEDILIDPELNGRHEDTDIESLAADIEANEQLTPVVCRKDDKGKPVLVFGHRRYRAFCLLNARNPESPRKINFIYRKYDQFGGFVAAIGENRFRRDVSPIDDASNMEILQRKFGKSEDEIASIYFPEAKEEKALTAALRFVKDRMSLNELAKEAAQAVRDGRIKLTAAVALSRLTREQQRKKVSKQGQIKGADVKASKPKGAKKSASIDPQLQQQIEALVETADFENYDSKKTGVWIEVNYDCLMLLKAYLPKK